LPADEFNYLQNLERLSTPMPILTFGWFAGPREGRKEGGKLLQVPGLRT